MLFFNDFLERESCSFWQTSPIARLNRYSPAEKPRKPWYNSGTTLTTLYKIAVFKIIRCQSYDLVCSAALLRYRWSLLSASGITVSTLFKMVPIKCCFFRVNEGKLTLLNFPKEASTTEVYSILVSCGFILCGFIYFLNMSTWPGFTAKLMLKGCTLLCPVEEWEAQAIRNILLVS